MKMRKFVFLMLIAVAASAQQTPNVPSANQSINIQAVFDSESRTYFYRDELNITVMADKNCYFKIIHIDTDNQMRMIYPNNMDRNNELRANTPRSIFENVKYRFWGPYGTETILVIASAEKFENIEREYNAPFIPAAKTSEGETRYAITILKPDEEYEYTLPPEDVAGIVETMREDVLRQGGTFDERRGFYILNNVRGSYRVPSGAPDTIQFASYNLDGFSDERNAGVQARGVSPFTFSFKKPGDLTQTIQTVRSGIESKGGTFTGNEQQGSFKASGITGQYRITEMVDVTITDRTGLAKAATQNYIESEVKKYFGAQ